MKLTELMIYEPAGRIHPAGFTVLTALFAIPFRSDSYSSTLTIRT